MEQLEDRSLLATLSIGPSGLHVAEGGTATLQATISQVQMQPVTVYFRTVAGTAIENTDYSGIPSGSVTIPPGAMFANISINALNDIFLEDPETFSVELTGASGATVDPSGDSTVVTIDNVQSGGGGGSGGSLTVSLSLPSDVNEGESFTMTGTVSAGGYYNISGAINWGTTSGEGPTSFSVTTNPNGTFTISHRYFDDGPDPGNGTPQDVQAITLAGTATPMMGGSSLTVTGSTSTTIHNVAPTPVFDVYNYMPLGGPWWVAAGTFQDVGLTDKGTLEIDWGDGSAHLIASGLDVGDTFSQMHRYPPEGLSYTISMTITDDDTGSVSYSEGFGLYLFDLDNDANNSGTISSIDEAFEPPAEGPGRYITVNADDDNGNEIPDLEEASPITGEDDLQPFLVRWQAANRPDINDYYGWHLSLRVPHNEPDQYFLDPRIWFNPDKSGGQLDVISLDSPETGYGHVWTVGIDSIPETLFLEARQAGGIGLGLRLWTPSWQQIEEDLILFTAVEPPSVDVDVDSDNNGVIDGTWAEDSIEMIDPGKVVLLNDDDDNFNGTPDFEDPTPFVNGQGTRMADNDLVPVKITVLNPYNITGYKVRVTSSANLLLWNSDSKNFTAYNEYVYGSYPTFPLELFAEGIETGVGTIETTLLDTNGVIVSVDEVKLTVVTFQVDAYRPTVSNIAPHVIPRSQLITPGVGIRVNGDDDNVNGTMDLNDSEVAGEDDLIKLSLQIIPPTAGVYLGVTRGGPIDLYYAPTKGETDFFMVGDTSDISTDSSGKKDLWAEWRDPAPASGGAGGSASLTFFLRAGLVQLGSKHVTFHPYSSLVVIVGGRLQTPDPSGTIAGNNLQGLYQIGIKEYQDHGYDVRLYAHTDVEFGNSSAPPYGSGPAYDEIVSAVNNRGVNELALLGYSWGGGAVYDLSHRLARNLGPVGGYSVLTDIVKPFSVVLTSYIDGISHNSWADFTEENGRPVGSLYHVNQYETIDMTVHGGPSGGDYEDNVSLHSWGSSLTHTTIDDNTRVQDVVAYYLERKVVPF